MEGGVGEGELVQFNFKIWKILFNSADLLLLRTFYKVIIAPKQKVSEGFSTKWGECSTTILTFFSLPPPLLLLFRVDNIKILPQFPFVTFLPRRNCVKLQTDAVA